MSADRLPEQGFLPNPHETITPSTARDAFEDAFRYMSRELPKEKLRELLEGMGSHRVVEAVQGMPTELPLNTLELWLGNTLEYCARKGLVRTTFQAIGAMESEDSNTYVVLDRTDRLLLNFFS